MKREKDEESKEETDKEEESKEETDKEEDSADGTGTGDEDEADKEENSDEKTTETNNQEFIQILTPSNIISREDKDTDSAIISTYYYGEVYAVIEKDGNWVKSTKGGWLNLVDKNEKDVAVIITKSSHPETYDNILKDYENKNKDEGSDGKADAFNYTYEPMFSTSGSDVAYYNKFLTNAKGIFGIPYQFNDLADRRYKSEQTSFGRKYTSSIMAKMPLLLLTPGKPKFMAGYNKTDKGNILTALFDTDGNSGSSDLAGSMLENLTNEATAGKFFSFEFAYSEYYEGLNHTLQRMAMLLGIGDIKIPSDSNTEGLELRRYRWENYANDALKGFVSSNETIAFYMDEDSQASESLSNTTGASMLDGITGGASDMANEMQFILGGAAGVDFQDNLKDGKLLENVNDFIDKYLGIFPETVLKKLTSGTNSVLAGGKLMFPEIWKDSDFNRNYNIEIKLRTPDADPLSWFLNIGAPLMHLIYLAAPRSLNTNAYQAPFLVRGYHKGFFNCDMGMITSLDIKKGADGRWTTAGLPMVVDVSITLKDLYQIMSITTNGSMEEFLHNTAFLDYTANLCGINVNRPDILRSMAIYANFFTTSVQNKVTFNGFLGVENALSNLVSGAFAGKGRL